MQCMPTTHQFSEDACVTIKNSSYHTTQQEHLLTATAAAAYLELLLALVIGELLGLPVLGFRGLLALCLLWSWVLPDSSMHLCTTHWQCQYPARLQPHNVHA